MTDNRNPASGEDFSRRAWLRRGLAGLAGVAASGSDWARLGLLAPALAQSSPVGFKALVCVFLEGGNDSNNLLVPFDGQLREQYEQGRGILALPAEQLQRIAPQGEARGFGLHPECDGLAQLFNQGRLALVANLGTLAYPIANREEYASRAVPRPPRLFSHSDQQLQWQSALVDKPFQLGWGGRVAAALDPLFNTGVGADRVSISLSLSGINNFQIADGVEQFVLSAAGAATLSGYGTAYANAINPDGSYRDRDPGRRLSALDEINTMARARGQLFEAEYARTYQSARETEARVGAALAASSVAEAAGGFTLDGIFTDAGAQGSLANQLKMVARLLAGRAELGNRRQIFFVRLGGFDTHQRELVNHAALMRQVSSALSAFYASTERLGIGSAVTTFTASDFNRTFTPNGTDAEAGADHGWGGHALVMGGAVAGQRIYGTFPQLLVGSAQDVDRVRGRWLPTTSVDQYAAVLARWLGLEGSALEAVFPNLHRFDSPFAAGSGLGFLPVS